MWCADGYDRGRAHLPEPVKRGEGHMTDTATRGASLESLLMSRSLSDPELLQASDEAPDYPILPDVSVIKLGGQSLIDRGRAAVYPVVEELVAVKRSHQKFSSVQVPGLGLGTCMRWRLSLVCRR